MRISEWTSDVCSSDLPARQLDMNPGNKTSALETLGRLDIDGKKGPKIPEKFDPGPIDGVDLSNLPDFPTDLPPLPDGPARPAEPAKVDDLKKPPDLKPDRGDILPPLPERRDRKSNTSELQSLMRISYA